MVMEEFVAYAHGLSVVIEDHSRMEFQNKAHAVMAMIAEWCRKNKMNIAENTVFKNDGLSGERSNYYHWNGMHKTAGCE